MYLFETLNIPQISAPYICLLLNNHHTQFLPDPVHRLQHLYNSIYATSACSVSELELNGSNLRPMGPWSSSLFYVHFCTNRICTGLRRAASVCSPRPGLVSLPPVPDKYSNYFALLKSAQAPQITNTHFLTLHIITLVMGIIIIIKHLTGVQSIGFRISGSCFNWQKSKQMV